MKLQSIVMPLSEFDHPEKGDALYGEFNRAGLFGWVVPGLKPKELMNKQVPSMLLLETSCYPSHSSVHYMDMLV